MEEIEKKPDKSPFPPRRPKLVLQTKIFLIPTFITSVGIFCGFLAIISTFRGNFEYAVRCIALAFILDGLDGRVARRLNATSAFGREFDSLSDLVAFGVAPGCLIYTWAFAGVLDEFGILVSFSFLVCGATRLARFNISSDNTKHFVGLPIPGAAAALASWVHFYPLPLQNIYFISLTVCFTLLLSFLMVSRFPFLSIKHLKLERRRAPRYVILLSVFVALLWYHSRSALVAIFTAYALSGLILITLRRVAPRYFEKAAISLRRSGT